MGPYHLLIGSLIDPSDDFCQSLRKSMISLIFFPGSLITLIYTVQLALALEATQAAITRFLGDLILTLSFWAQYAYLRKKRHVSDLQAALLPWGIMLCLTIFFLNNCEYDNKSFAVTMSLVAVLLQIPKVGFFLVYCYLLAILHEWNISHLTEPDLLLVLPGAMKDRDLLQRFLSGLMGTSLIALGIYNFIRQVQELERRGAAQKAANEMTLSVLQRHKKYDTEGVSTILGQCAKERVVDPELIALFKTMNSNLENYRPFLPNYLFNDDSDDDKDQEDEGAISQSEAGGASQSSRRMDEASRRSSQRSQTYSIPADNQSQSSRMGVAAHVDPTLAITLNKRGALFQGRVTFALVDICADRLTHCEFVGNTAEILQPVVNMVYSLAKETKASVHSMLGDTVQLTWNATQPVALPETKGAVFLCRLARYFQQGGQEEIKTLAALSTSQQEPQPTDTAVPEPTVPLILNAAVCSGKASVHSITSASTQQALIIEAPWLPSLEGCLELAKRVGGAAPISGSLATPGCVLMDDRTMKGSQLEVDSCAVEMVRFSEGERPTFLGQYEGLAGSSSHSSSAAQVTAVIHQLLGEHVRADDEWMYQLQGGDANDAKEGSEKPHLRAVLMASEGRYREALEALSAADETSDTAQSSNSPKSSKIVNANPAFAKALQARCLRGS